MSKELEAAKKRIAELEKQHRNSCCIIHNMVVANQAAWIECFNGKGADAAMKWITNGLQGPGHIPRGDDENINDAQAYFDAHVVDSSQKMGIH